ncbi:hypothetical protein KM043_012666 [Ampulex compressa]|nr:hypothetical protein KM043_012666 [Ampulex compressa]
MVLGIFLADERCGFNAQPRILENVANSYGKTDAVDSKIVNSANPVPPRLLSHRGRPLYRAVRENELERDPPQEPLHLPSDTSVTRLTVRQHAHTNCYRVISSDLALGGGQRKL